MTCRRGHEAELVGGDVVYPHRPDLAEKRFWICRPCDAWVGVHAGTAIPLGSLADTETRKARKLAHAYFDALWKGGSMSRKEAYARLAHYLGIEVRDCHIGSFDAETCGRVVAFVREESTYKSRFAFAVLRAVRW